MSDSDVPDDLYYTREHHWVRAEDGIAIVGLTDHAQNELGDIVCVELPKRGESVRASDEMGAIDSIKTSTELYAPVSGEIVETNEKLERSPELINQDPYGAGWIVRIRLSDPAELDELLDAEEYCHMVYEGE